MIIVLKNNIPFHNNIIKNIVNKLKPYLVLIKVCNDLIEKEFENINIDFINHLKSNINDV